MFIKKESFVYAAQLRFFEVIETKIVEISSRAFAGAEELEEISFEGCEIGKIAFDAFDGLPKLKKIKLKKSKFPTKGFLENLPSHVKVVQ